MKSDSKKFQVMISAVVKMVSDLFPVGSIIAAAVHELAGACRPRVIVTNIVQVVVRSLPIDAIDKIECHLQFCDAGAAIPVFLFRCRVLKQDCI
jgi:hypothetical protein